MGLFFGTSPAWEYGREISFKEEGVWCFSLESKVGRLL